MEFLRTISCANPDCREDFSTEKENAEYCPKCEPNMKKKTSKPKWRTISIKSDVRKELLKVQNSIIRTEGERIGYSDIIRYGLSLAQKSQNFIDEMIVMLKNDNKI